MVRWIVHSFENARAALIAAQETGQPVILELDPEDADMDSLVSLGIKVFESVHSLKHYVESEAKVSAGEGSA